APYGLEGLRGVGTIVIPGWAHMRATISDELKATIMREYNDGARIVSICSGAVVPGELGLLDGKHATTHWMYTDLLRERCPAVIVEPDVLYVDEGQVLTSAGSAAGVDLGLYIIRHDFGSEAANTVARRMIVPPHRDGGQAQFIDRPVPDDGGRLARVMDGVRAELSAAHDVDTLAREAGMSVRTLHRRFQEATGLPPAKWVAEERIKHAKDLLETTSLSIEQVAAHCGFGGAEVLRHHFRKSMGLSPQNYRRRFTRLTA
ncbi:MAG: helix-turn-helix domain-containing protein, partial [Sphingomonadales bacterium]|nr:helix-turn-helix domain-containing protein [Sphingomonadales bacterium]